MGWVLIGRKCQFTLYLELWLTSLSYWHPNIDEDRYSFVDFVISQGYSIFYYDRLGMSESTKYVSPKQFSLRLFGSNVCHRVSGYKAQLSTQVAVLHELIAQIKSGKWISPLSQAKKVVLVGHSYGSSISLAALSADETLADGLVLTGKRMTRVRAFHCILVIINWFQLQALV